MEKISIVNRIAIGDIVRRTANRLPHKEAIIDGDKRITYQELELITNRFANYLLASGFKKGDTVATICANSWQFIVAIFGIQKAGLICVPINPMVSINEKNHILSEVKAKLVICDKEFLHEKESILKLCPKVLVTREENDRLEDRFESTLNYGDSSVPNAHIEDRDTAQIMYTSGTTGVSKGVVISHLSVYISSLANIIEVGIKQDEVGTVMLPIFHCAQHTVVVSFLHLGATLVVIRAFEPTTLLATIRNERVTWMLALPMMYRALLAIPTRTKSDTKSLRSCVYAMAPMDEATLKRGMEEFGAEFSLGTGQTEMYPVTVNFKPEYQLQKKGSYWGTSSLMNDTAIMDENGQLLKQGEVGEIVHRGPNVMSCYYNRPEETEISRLFDWHHTGDLGYFDEDGLLVFVDRKKDMIKTGGENVASILVEQTILFYEKVANAVVIGLPHEHWIEAITAFVVLKPGSEASEEDIIAHCKKHLSGFQVPKEVVIVDELPMTATGKIQKHALRKRYETFYNIN